MRAVVYRQPFEVAVGEIPDRRIEQPGDEILLTASTCICGSYLPTCEGRTAAESGIARRRVRPAQPGFVVSHELPLDEASYACQEFDQPILGYTKVVLKPELA